MAPRSLGCHHSAGSLCAVFVLAVLIQHSVVSATTSGSIYHEGNLMQLGAEGETPQIRYCVLNDQTLTMFVSKRNPSAVRVISVKDIRGVESMPSIPSVSGKQFCMRVQEAQEDIYLCDPNGDGSRGNWLAAINRIVPRHALYAPRFSEVEASTGEFVMAGWVKYFIFRPFESVKPTSFYRNPDWDNNPDARSNATAPKDQWGEVAIPDKNHFFFGLTNKQLVVSAQRSTDRTVDSLDVSRVNPTNPGPPLSGGLEDQGSFKEGFCWSMKTTGANSERQLWQVCADNAAAKTKWLAALLKVVPTMANDTESGPTNIFGLRNPTFKKDGNSSSDDDITVSFDTQDQTVGSKDGKWLTIQDWSPCSVTCGGGISVRQRWCLPPKNGGKSCDGAATESKPCNTGPCPSPSINLPPITAPPQVKVIAISARPGRYIDCVLKDGDMQMMMEDKDTPEGQPAARMPAHVVMNNRTITVFESLNPTTAVLSLDVPDVRVGKHPRGPENCFEIRQPKTKQTVGLCTFGATAHMTENEQALGWIEAVERFRDACQGADKNELPKDLVDKKMQSLAVEYLEKKAECAAEDKEKKIENHMENEVQLAAAAAMSQLQKEIAREQLEEKEEIEREKEEENAIKEKVKNTEAQANCVKKQIERQHRIQALTKAQDDIRDKINQIEKEAEITLRIRRAREAIKLNKMKRISRTNARLAQRKIQIIREEMAKTVMEAEKEGNATTCATVHAERAEKQYCKQRMSGDLDRLRACEDGDTFCELCCAEEFGDLHEAERIKCQRGCNEACSSCSQTNAIADKGGRWVFVPESNYVKHHKNSEDDGQDGQQQQEQQGQMQQHQHA